VHRPPYRFGPKSRDAPHTVAHARGLTRALALVGGGGGHNCGNYMRAGVGPVLLRRQLFAKSSKMFGTWTETVWSRTVSGRRSATAEGARQKARKRVGVGPTLAPLARRRHPTLPRPFSERMPSLINLHDRGPAGRGSRMVAQLRPTPVRRTLSAGSGHHHKCSQKNIPRPSNTTSTGKGNHVLLGRILRA
jgi:hypothetical protein